MQLLSVQIQSSSSKVIHIDSRATTDSSKFIVTDDWPQVFIDSLHHSYYIRFYFPFIHKTRSKKV